MRSWLVSALRTKVVQAGMKADGLERLSRGDWLVWEPGTWRPSKANSQTSMGIPQLVTTPAGAAAESLAIALESKPDRAEVTFGRVKCDVVVDDRTLSSHHLSFLFDDHHWWVRDVGSRNGTLLDGRRLGTVPERLTAGAVVQPAQVVLTYYTPAVFLQRLQGARK